MIGWDKYGRYFDVHLTKIGSLWRFTFYLHVLLRVFWPINLLLLIHVSLSFVRAIPSVIWLIYQIIHRPT